MAISNSTIYIYNGNGANETCVKETSKKLKNRFGQNYNIIEVDASYLAKEAKASAYVLPGGKAMLMGGALKDSISKIKGYIEQGSGMLAICAGAMVASSNWEYRIPIANTAEEIDLSIDCADERFNFSPQALGPVVIDGIHKPNDFKGSKPQTIKINQDDKTFKCFWVDGPAFKPMNDTDKVIASYKDISNPLVKDSSAVLYTTYHQGKIAMLGIHPELAEWSFEHEYDITNEDVQLNNELFYKSCDFIGLKQPQTSKEEQQ